LISGQRTGRYRLIYQSSGEVLDQNTKWTSLAHYTGVDSIRPFLTYDRQAAIYVVRASCTVSSTTRAVSSGKRSSSFPGSEVFLACHNHKMHSTVSFVSFPVSECSRVRASSQSPHHDLSMPVYKNGRLPNVSLAGSDIRLTPP